MVPTIDFITLQRFQLSYHIIKLIKISSTLIGKSHLPTTLYSVVLFYTGATKFKEAFDEAKEIMKVKLEGKSREKL